MTVKCKQNLSIIVMMLLMALWLPPVAKSQSVELAVELASMSTGADTANSALEQSIDIIRLGPSQARIIDLPRPAAAVIVAAPDALSALLDSPTRMILIPRQISATSLTVLDEAGQPILESAVIISGRNNATTRVIRGCTASGNCLPSTVEYCAGDCVTLPLLTRAPQAASTGGTEPTQTNDDSE